MTWKGDPHHVRQRRRVVCGDYGEELAVDSMATHLQNQHVRSGRSRLLPQPMPLTAPREYRVAFPRTATDIDCPVEGCPWRATILTNLRLQFMHRHVEDILVVLIEGPGTHHQCGQCDMFIPRGVMVAGHLSTKTYKRGQNESVSIYKPLPLG